MLKDIVGSIVKEKEENNELATQLLEVFSVTSDEDGYFDYRGCITTLINKGIDGKQAVALTEQA
jgi:hypothetical protein